MYELVSAQKEVCDQSDNLPEHSSRGIPAQSEDYLVDIMASFFCRFERHDQSAIHVYFFFLKTADMLAVCQNIKIM